MKKKIDVSANGLTDFVADPRNPRADDDGQEDEVNIRSDPCTLDTILLVKLIKTCMDIIIAATTIETSLSVYMINSYVVRFGAYHQSLVGNTLEGLLPYKLLSHVVPMICRNFSTLSGAVCLSCVQ